jgi:hypothetical protein
MSTACHSTSRTFLPKGEGEGMVLGAFAGYSATRATASDLRRSIQGDQRRGQSARQLVSGGYRSPRGSRAAW